MKKHSFNSKRGEGDDLFVLPEIATHNIRETRRMTEFRHQKNVLIASATHAFGIGTWDQHRLILVPDIQIVFLREMTPPPPPHYFAVNSHSSPNLPPPTLPITCL